MTWTDFKEYSSDVQLQIGQRIQKLRIDKKIAAVDLAAVLDIQSNQMSRIENGRANCTVPQLYVISQILGSECSLCKSAILHSRDLFVPTGMIFCCRSTKGLR